MILRAKTKFLFDQFELNEAQKKNSEFNLREIDKGITELKSFPRRLVLELTNACNLNCMMCGRNSTKFNMTTFDLQWLEKLDGALKEAEEVALFGWGEPTVHPDFRKILELLDKYPVRKYFCTNGMRLSELKEDIFKYNVDIIAISVDGGTAETNNAIRRGSDLDKISKSLKEIVEEKRQRKISKPYMNFVFCAMESNLKELPKVVELAANIGLEEVKVVYLTAFDEHLVKETLWNKKERVDKIFKETVRLAESLSIKLKLPHLQGEDEAGDRYHKDCFVGWRDFFLGSDGHVRPCMSTPVKFFNIDDYDTFEEMWNHEKYIEFRQNVNFANSMDKECKRCYQSSHCNWNRKESYIQIGENFAPDWKE
nr:radical SAM protein [uncultured Aminipila sp.]